MYSYVLILVGYNCLPNNNEVKLFCNEHSNIFTTNEALSIMGKPTQPQLKTTSTYNKLAPIRYKKYIMAKGEGLWQVAAKNKIAKKDMAVWIALVAKKNKLFKKDNNNDYILQEGDAIWIPI